MPKNIIYTLLIIVMMGCDNSSSKNNFIKRYKVETFVDSFKIKNEFKGYENNSVIRDELNESFKKEFKKVFNTGLFDDYPFILDKVEKCNNKYVVYFNHQIRPDNEKERLIGEINFELYGLVDEKTAKSLIEKKRYFLKSQFREFLYGYNKDNYCAFSLWSPFMGYSQSNGYEEIQFGAIGIQIDSILDESSKYK